MVTSESRLRKALDLLFTDGPVLDIYAHGPWAVPDGLLDEAAARIDTLVADRRSAQLTVGKQPGLRTPTPAVVADVLGMVAFLCGDAALRAGACRRIEHDLVERFRIHPVIEAEPERRWFAQGSSWRPPGRSLFQAAGDDRARRMTALDLTTEALQALDGVVPLNERRRALLRLYDEARRDADLLEATLATPYVRSEWARLEDRWAELAGDDLVAVLPELTGPVGYLSWIVDGWIAAHERLSSLVPGGGDPTQAFVSLLIQAGMTEAPAELAVGVRCELYSQVQQQLRVVLRTWNAEAWRRRVRDWLARALVAGELELSRAWLDLSVRLTGAVQGLPGAPVTPRPCLVPVDCFQQDVRRLFRVRRVRHPLTGSNAVAGWVAADDAFPFGTRSGGRPAGEEQDGEGLDVRPSMRERVGQVTSAEAPTGTRDVSTTGTARESTEEARGEAAAGETLKKATDENTRETTGELAAAQGQPSVEQKDQDSPAADGSAAETAGTDGSAAETAGTDGSAAETAGTDGPAAETAGTDRRADERPGLERPDAAAGDGGSDGPAAPPQEWGRTSPPASSRPAVPAPTGEVPGAQESAGDRPVSADAPADRTQGDPAGQPVEADRAGENHVTGTAAAEPSTVAGPDQVTAGHDLPEHPDHTAVSPPRPTTKREQERTHQVSGSPQLSPPGQRVSEASQLGDASTRAGAGRPSIAESEAASSSVPPEQITGAHAKPVPPDSGEATTAFSQQLLGLVGPSTAPQGRRASEVGRADADTGPSRDAPGTDHDRHASSEAARGPWGFEAFTGHGQHPGSRGQDHRRNGGRPPADRSADPAHPHAEEQAASGQAASGQGASGFGSAGFPGGSGGYGGLSNQRRPASQGGYGMPSGAGAPGGPDDQAGHTQFGGGSQSGSAAYGGSAAHGGSHGPVGQGGPPFPPSASPPASPVGSPSNDFSWYNADPPDDFGEPVEAEPEPADFALWSRREPADTRAQVLALIDRIVGQPALVTALREAVTAPEQDLRLLIAGPPGTGEGMTIDVLSRLVAARGFDGTAITIRYEHLAQFDPTTAVAQLREWVDGCLGERLLAIEDLDQIISDGARGAALAEELHRLISICGPDLQVVAFTGADGYRRLVDVNPALAAWWRVVRTRDFDAGDYTTIFGRVVEQRGALATDDAVRRAGDMLAATPAEGQLRNARLAAYLAEMAIDSARRRTDGSSPPMVDLADLPRFETEPSPPQHAADGPQPGAYSRLGRLR